MPGANEIDTSGMARAHQLGEGLLAEAPQYVAGTDPEHVEAVGSFYENVLEGIRVHHGAEDAMLYPRLEERCEAERDLVRRIGSQHQLLHEPMEVAFAAISQWRADPSDANAEALVSALSHVLEVYSPHCRDEEDLIMPLAGRHISLDEWYEMVPHETENYRFDKMWMFIGLAQEHGSTEFFEGLPEPVRDQWTNEWSLEYEPFMMKVRGH